MADPNYSAIYRINGRAFLPNTSRPIDCILQRDTSGNFYSLIASYDTALITKAERREVTLDMLPGTHERKVIFPNGTMFQTTDPDLGEFLGEQGMGGMIRNMSSFGRGLVMFCLLAIFGVFALWRYGVPFLAAMAVAATPQSAKRAIDNGFLQSVDATIAYETSLSREEQKAQEAIFYALAEEAPAEYREHFTLVFRDLRGFGPNAAALPGGTMILTDELVELFGDQPDVIAGDLGPVMEVVLREGQALLSLRFSRDDETEADLFGVALAAKAGYDPAGITEFFRYIAQNYEGEDDREWLSSHPLSTNRVNKIELFIRTQGL